MLKKCLSDDAHQVDFRANSVLSLGFATRRGSVYVLRGRCNAWQACRCYRVVFSWQAQHFVPVYCLVSCWKVMLVPMTPSSIITWLMSGSRLATPFIWSIKVGELICQWKGPTGGAPCTSIGWVHIQLQVENRWFFTELFLSTLFSFPFWHFNIFFFPEFFVKKPVFVSPCVPRLQKARLAPACTSAPLGSSADASWKRRSSGRRGKWSWNGETCDEWKVRLTIC